MDTSLITMEDIEYLAGQSVDNMNVILASMTALMDENNQKTSMLETQTWFQRMSRTISGKNKMTQAEIQQNHDKINLYLSQALSELYDRSCIDQQIIMSLGTRLNELYADHIQLKQMLGAFVDRLNQKIISIDNFHMLETEIEQGVYDGLMPISAMCKVLSQLDTRTLNDSRKMDILERSLREKGIISEQPAAISEYLMALLDTSDREIGIIYMELETLGDNVIAVIFKNVIENYHFLSGLSRKIRKKEEVAKKVIQENQLDDSVELSLEDIYHELLEAKVTTVPRIEVQEAEAVEIVARSDELQRGIDAFLKYSVDEAYEILKPLNEGFAKYLISFLCDEIVFGTDASTSCLEEGYILGDLFASVRYAKRCSDETKAMAIIQENIEELKRLAIHGDLFAQYEYAVLCSESSLFKIPHDEVNVRELLQKAIDQGFWMAKRQLARRYHYGIDGDVDYEKAFRMLYDLDKIGMNHATIELAHFYMLGLYVEQNKTTAVKLFEKAAQTTPEAKYNLALCYELGDGVYKDIEKATDLYVECITEVAGDIFSDIMNNLFGGHFVMNPIKPRNGANTAAYKLYLLHKNESDAAFYLCISAKCGHPYALYKCAKFYLTDGEYDYLETFPDDQYLDLASTLFSYDIETAKYCLAEAKKYTKDEDLLGDIELLELKMSIGEVKDVFTNISSSIKNLFN